MASLRWFKWCANRVCNSDVNEDDDDDDVSPEVKAEREKLRRRQNNARERFV